MATNYDIIAILNRELNLANISTVLDLGCGSFLNSIYDYTAGDILTAVFKDKIIKGVDIFQPNIDWRHKFGPKGDYICEDVNTFDLSGKYDAIICHHVLEHLTQKEHDELFLKIEQSFNKYAIIGGPNGFYNNDSHIEWTGNQHEKHKIGLDPSFYESKGYKVFKIDNVFLAIKEK